MTLDISNLKRLSPSIIRMIAFTIAVLIVGLLILFLGILPKRAASKTINAEIQSLNTHLNQMRTDIANTEKQKQLTHSAMAERDRFLASGVIEPLLGSLAMRGKSLLDPIAQRTGFHIDSVRELSATQLQIPTKVPEQRYNRQPIEFSGQGSFAQITAFISQVEAAHPLATLSSLRILGQTTTPEIHKALITFEWPVKGEKIKPGSSLQRK